MTKEEFDRWYNPTTIENGKRYLHLLLDTYFEKIHETHEPIVYSAREAYAQRWLQMFFTKGIAFEKLLEGYGYKLGEWSMNRIVDHTSLFMIARNLCETLTAFELICVLPDTDEKRLILESLFESSGYKYKLGLYSDQMQREHPEQYLEEQQIVNDATEHIFQTAYYQSLPEKYQKLLVELVDKKNFQVLLLDGKVRKLSWQEAMQEYMAPNGIFDGIYNYFSLNTHPSIISMNQFDQAFERNNPEYLHFCLTATLYMITYLSMFLQEYISIYPKAKAIFDSQDEDVKWMLTLYDYRKNKTIL